MSEKKIKIKELACELKVSNPDMLKAALDEGISARNSAARSASEPSISVTVALPPSAP